MSSQYHEAGSEPPANGERSPFRVSFPADPAQLAGVRHALVGWAARSGLLPADVEALVLAANEAVANAIEHAYPDGGGEVSVAAAIEDGRSVVTVVDRGCWRPPPADPGSRGRGLTLIERLAHGARVSCDDAGTTVRMWWRLPR